METAKLTNNEKSVLVAIVANAKSVGDNGVEFILEDVAREMGKNIRSISATAGSLAKKGMLLTADGESYFDGIVTEAGLHEVEEDNKVNQEVNNSKNQGNMETNNFETPVMDERIVKLNELKSVKMSSLSKSKRPAAKEAKGLAAYVLNNWDNQQALEQLLENAKDEAATELGKSVLDIAQNRRNQMNAIKVENGRKEAEARLKKAASKKETKKANKTEQPKEKTAKTARKVGDIHPNGLWVWTEYKPGKFDWRTKDKKVRTPKETSSQKTTSTKKSSSVKKNGAAKEEERKKKETATTVTRKRATIEDVIRLRPASVPNFTAAQKRAWKLIRQGWRREGIFLTNGTKRERVGEETLSGMWEKLGIKFIPVGFIVAEEE